MSNRIIVILLLSAHLLISCKSTKESLSVKSGKVNVESLLSELAESRKKFEWFSAKARITYDDNEKSKSFSVNIRIKKDSIVWASIKTMMGIEVARVLITQDSVHVIDRFGKKYFKQNYQYLENYIPFQLNLSAIQNIIFGNPIRNWSEIEKIKFRSKGDSYILTKDTRKTKNSISITHVERKLSTEYLVDKQSNRKVSLIFKNYRESDNTLFSHQRSISFEDENNIDIEMKFTKVKLVGPLHFPFHISEKYERF